MYERLVGLRVTEIVTKPLVDGRYEQVAIMFGEDPVVDLFLQPGSILLLTLNVALPATDARAVTSFVWRKVSVPPARDIEAVVDPAAKVTVV